MSLKIKSLSKENELENQKLINKMNLQREEALRRLEIQTEVNRKKEAEEAAVKQAEKDIQVVYDAIADAQRERKAKDDNQELAKKEAIIELEKVKQKAYADTVAQIMASIGPDLAASLQANANIELTKAIASSVSPYAIAKNESISDAVNKMVRGLPVETVLTNIDKNKE